MRLVIAFGFLLAWFGNAQAADISEQVALLIKQVALSECSFIRNEETYSSLEAADHMRFKYDYYKDDIVTLTDFIEKVGTKSSFSGKIYVVNCKGEGMMPSAEWLRNKTKDLE